MAKVDHVDVLVGTDLLVVDVFDEDCAWRWDLVQVGDVRNLLGRD